MTLQQLRYLVAIAECGSINAAANNLYSSQSNLSTAIKDLESELGITAFRRTTHGVSLTNEGTELLGYARQVIEQADILKKRYSKDEKRLRLAISTQHYAFSVQAFVNIIEECASEQYEFILRECTTGQIIDDVKNFRSDLGILYTDAFNLRALQKSFNDANLLFTPLFQAAIHVFVGAQHPLACREALVPEDLEDYPRYSFEQGTQNSFFFSEEPFAFLPHKRSIHITDRGTLSNLLTSFNGYTLSTGVLSSEMHSGIVSIPLDVNEVMKVGYLVHRERRPSLFLLNYIGKLRAAIKSSANAIEYIDA